MPGFFPATRLQVNSNLIERPARSITQQWQGTNQRLEIPVVVVVADEEQLQTILSAASQFRLHLRSKRTRVPSKGLRIESMMNGHDTRARPSAQIIGKASLGATVISAQ